MSDATAAGRAETLAEAARTLQSFATERFDRHGVDDARGAALWDAACHLVEVMGDGDWRRDQASRGWGKWMAELRTSAVSASSVVVETAAPTDDLAARRDAREGSGNVTCACGGEWWTTDGITIDPRDEHVTGYALPLRCKDCGAER